MPRTRLSLRSLRTLLYAACGAGLIALAAPAQAPAQTRDKVVVASKIDTEGGLLGQMIALMLERQGIPVENRVQLGPTKVVRTALLSGEIDIYPEYTGNGAFFHGMENDPVWKAAPIGLRDGQAPRRARRTSSSGSIGRRPTTPGSSPYAATSPGAKSSRRWRISRSFPQRPGRPQARRLGRVRRKRRGAAVLRAGLQFQAAPRSDRRPARRRHRRHHARRSPERERRQRRHGLRHGRVDRGPRPRRHGGHQGRADRVRAGARHPCRRAAALSGNRAGPGAGLRLALDEQAPGAQRADRRRRASRLGKWPSATSSKRACCAEDSRVVSHARCRATDCDTAVDLFAAGRPHRDPCVRPLRPDWLAMAPNRLLPGQPVSAVQALGLAAHGVIALALFAENRRASNAVALPLRRSSSSRRSRLPSGKRDAAAEVLLHDRPPAARALSRSRFLARLRGAGRARRSNMGARRAAFAVPAVAALILAIVAAGVLAGRFDSLSLMVEYKASDGERPCRLPAAYRPVARARSSSPSSSRCRSVGPSFRSQRIEALVNAVLSAVQVTPAIALFGLLIPLLAGLLAAAPRPARPRALGAIGPAPALIGVAIYLALPLLRGLVSGLRSTDPAVVEAAQAMGMTEARMMLRGAHSARAADPRRSASRRRRAEHRSHDPRRPHRRRRSRRHRVRGHVATRAGSHPARSDPDRRLGIWRWMRGWWVSIGRSGLRSDRIRACVGGVRVRSGPVGRDLHGRAGRPVRARRTVRVGQVDAPAPRQPARRADFGPRPRARADVATLDPAPLRRSIGYVIQSIGLFPHRTVADNVATVPRLLGWPKAEDRRAGRGDARSRPSRRRRLRQPLRRRSFRADRRSASALPAPLRPIPTSSSWTSRSAPSTRSRART